MALAADPHDRVGERRADEAWLEAAWADPESRVLTLFGQKGGVGTTALPMNAALRLRAPSQAAVLLVDLI